MLTSSCLLIHCLAISGIFALFSKTFPYLLIHPPILLMQGIKGVWLFKAWLVPVVASRQNKSLAGSYIPSPWEDPGANTPSVLCLAGPGYWPGLMKVFNCLILLCLLLLVGLGIYSSLNRKSLHSMDDSAVSKPYVNYFIFCLTTHILKMWTPKSAFLFLPKASLT